MLLLIFLVMYTVPADATDLSGPASKILPLYPRKQTLQTHSSGQHLNAILTASGVHWFASAFLR